MAKKTRVPPLKTIGDVKHFLARLIREAYRGDIEIGKASKLAYMTNLLRAAIEGHDLETRLAELEARLNAQEQP